LAEISGKDAWRRAGVLCLAPQLLAACMHARCAARWRAAVGHAHLLCSLPWSLHWLQGLVALL